MKKCSKCKEWKDESEFYRNNNRKTGLQAQCKICNRATVAQFSKTEKAAQMRKRYRQTERYKELMRNAMAEYRKTEKGKQVFHQMNTSEKGKARYARQRQTDTYKVRHRSDSHKYRKSHPEIIKAHNAIGLAIRQGKLPKPTTLKCNCGNQAKHYHHHKGYEPEHWLDVIPLCIQCHANEHNNQIYLEQYTQGHLSLNPDAQTNTGRAHS